MVGLHQKILTTVTVVGRSGSALDVMGRHEGGRVIKIVESTMYDALELILCGNGTDVVGSLSSTDGSVPDKTVTLA